MFDKVKANVGRVAINDILLKYCTTTRFTYTNDAGKWNLNIYIECATGTSAEADIRQLVGGASLVKLDVLSGAKLGGVGETSFLDCKINSINIAAIQGEIVTMEIKLFKEVFARVDK